MSERIIKLASKQAKEEGLEGNEFIKRVNELTNDALAEIPESEEAKKIKELSQQEVKEKPVFDYQQYRDDTSVVAVKEIIKTLGNYEHLVVKMKATDEEKQLVQKAYDDCSLEVFKILNEKKVSLGDYQFVFSALKSIANALEEYMMQQVNGHRSEIVSRLLGAKNPGTGKFDQQHATYKHITDLLEKSRKDTGDKLDDYFTMVSE